MKGYPRKFTRTTELTPDERHTLALAVRGLKNKDIADFLGITEDGVKWRLGRVYAKLGVRNREEAAIWARQNRGAR